MLGGHSAGQTDSLHTVPSDHLSASLLSMLTSLLNQGISVAITSLNSVAFTHYISLHFSVATGYQF